MDISHFITSGSYRVKEKKNVNFDLKINEA